MYNDEQYLNRLKHGDPLVFKEIYNKYHFKIYMFVRKFIQDTNDLEDVVQNIFIHLWNHRGSIALETPIEAVLFKTSRQEVALWYRKNQPSYLLEDKDILNATETPEETLIQNENIKKIFDLIDHMPERRKLIFKLNKFEEKSHKEIADALNMTTSAVANQISKSLKFLKYHLNSFFF